MLFINARHTQVHDSYEYLAARVPSNSYTILPRTKKAPGTRQSAHYIRTRCLWGMSHTYHEYVAVSRPVLSGRPRSYDSCENLKPAVIGGLTQSSSYCTPTKTTLVLIYALFTTIAVVDGGRLSTTYLLMRTCRQYHNSASRWLMAEALSFCFIVYYRSRGETPDDLQ